MRSHGYTQAQDDHTLFYKKSLNSKISTLILYIDDFLITRDDVVEVENKVFPNERIWNQGSWPHELLPKNKSCKI